MVMTVLRRGMREDLSFLLLAMTLSFTSQGEMSSSRLVSPDLSDLLLMMLPLVVKWLFVSLLLPPARGLRVGGWPRPSGWRGDVADARAGPKAIPRPTFEAAVATWRRPNGACRLVPRHPP